MVYNDWLIWSTFKSNNNHKCKYNRTASTTLQVAIRIPLAELAAQVWINWTLKAKTQLLYSSTLLMDFTTCQVVNPLVQDAANPSALSLAQVRSFHAHTMFFINVVLWNWKLESRYIPCCCSLLTMISHHCQALYQPISAISSTNINHPHPQKMNMIITITSSTNVNQPGVGPARPNHHPALRHVELGEIRFWQLHVTKLFHRIAWVERFDGLLMELSRGATRATRVTRKNYQGGCYQGYQAELPGLPRGSTRVTRGELPGLAGGTIWVELSHASEGFW